MTEKNGRLMLQRTVGRDDRDKVVVDDSLEVQVVKIKGSQVWLAFRNIGARFHRVGRGETQTLHAEVPLP